MGCICQPTKEKINPKYIEEKGVNEKHSHLLLFCEPNMRKNAAIFECFCCKKIFNNTGSFHCITCGFNLCRECFNYTGGLIYDKIQEGKKGIVSTHPEHELIYGRSNSKGKIVSNLNNNTLYKCNNCNIMFLINYCKCWSCNKCEFNICDKCFKDLLGKEI